MRNHALRLALAGAVVAVATAPMTSPATAVVCEFPMSVVCAAHAEACRYVPEETGKIPTHALLCTVAM